jgi:DNA-binding MarR family transcriptional regulator
MNTDIARIRRFNRALTLELGALDTSYLGRGRPLGAARLLCAIDPDGTEVGTLRETLALDSGLLSRLLRGLEEEDLITVTPDPADRRRRIARPTPKGAQEITAYDRLSDTRAGGMLAALGRETPALLAALERFTLRLSRDRIRITLTDPAALDAQTCLAEYFAELDRRVPGGFDPGPPSDPATYRPPQGAFLMATLDGLALGCVALSVPDREVKRLWIAPEARGLGLAPRLMTAIEDQARAMGLAQLRLDTNASLTEALALYRRSGWTAIPRYNDNPYAEAWFEKAL